VLQGVAWLLQCVALCWSVLKCSAVYYGVLYHDTVCRKCVAVCCSVLQFVVLGVMKCSHTNVERYSELQCVAVCCSALQCVALCCSVLRCVAMCCNILSCSVMFCCVLLYVVVCYSVM